MFYLEQRHFCSAKEEVILADTDNIQQLTYIHNLNVIKNCIKRCLLCKTWKDHYHQVISFIACYRIAANPCLLLIRSNC